MSTNVSPHPTVVNPQVRDVAVGLQHLIDSLRDMRSGACPIDIELVREISRISQQVGILDAVAADCAWLLETSRWN